MKRRIMFLGLIFILLSLIFGYSTNALAAVTSTCGQCHYNDMNTADPADDIDYVANFNSPNVIAVDKTVACKKCHYLSYHNTAVTSTPYGWFSTVDSPNSSPETMHNKHAGLNGPSTNASCSRCHGTVNCNTCHAAVPHQNHSLTKYTPVTLNVTDSTGVVSTQLSCATGNCHNQMPNVVRIRPDGSQLCKNCHQYDKSGHGDVTPIHTSNFLDTQPLPFNCSDCHQNTLNNEHASRVDANGNPLNCYTCHKNTSQTVKDAITNKNTNCNACHTVHGDPTAAHTVTSPYVSNPDVDCSQCHGASLVLSDYHLKNSDGTDRYVNGQKVTCNTCHQNTRTEVQQAIANHNKNCDACHTSRHTWVSHGAGTDFIPASQNINNLNCSDCHNRVLPVQHVGNITSSGAVMDCNTCHTNTNPTVQNAIATNSDQCNSCHVNAGQHSSVPHGAGTPYLVGTSTLNCADCHKRVLPDEHLSRVDKNNNPITCSTCHLNTDTKVKTAIATGQTNCDACHTVHGDINQTHATNYVLVNTTGMNCGGCHRSTLNLEHLSRTDKYGVTYTCNTCHQNSRADVRNAIATANTFCDACHTVHQPIDQQHDVSQYFANQQVNCSGCHIPTLNNEHFSRISATTGTQIVCSDCHESLNLTIRNAIESGNTNCDACHTSTDIHPDKIAKHTSAYVVNQDLDCSKCHQNALINEHTSRTGTNGQITCNTCHMAVDTAKVKAADVKTAISTGNTNCDACHLTRHTDIKHGAGTDFVPNQTLDCSSCHTRALNDQHVGKTTKAGVTMTCYTCHNSSRTDVQNAIATKTDTCNACHTIHSDITTVHQSSYVVNPQLDCSSCHKNVLSDEHTSRNGSNGQLMTCNTCHNAVDTVKVKAANVQAAIAAGNTNCDACHTIHSDITTIHSSTYIVNPAVDCSSCHKSVLSDEHTSRNGTNGQLMTCNTCHSAIDTAKVKATDVKAAIAAGNTNCDACHTIHPDVLTDHATTYVANSEVDCAKCHKAVLSDEHTNRNGSNGQLMTCNTCHKAVDTVKVKAADVQAAISAGNTNCDDCHKSRHTSVTHGSATAFITNQTLDCSGCHTRALDVQHVGKLASDGTTTMTCNTCHTNTRTDVQTAITNKNDTCDACHTGAGTHPTATHGDGTAFVANPTLNCSDCHVRKLDVEHSKSTSTTSTGAAITCTTCHNNSNTVVQNAIATSNTQCDACHNSSGIGTYHNTNHGAGTAFMVNPPLNCADCHNRALDTEHVGNVTKAGVTLTCTSCHQNTRTDVQTAIASKNTQCTACHSTAGTHPNANHNTTTFTTDTTTQNCAKCHKTDVSVEHSASSDKVNSAGVKMSCITCHQSTNSLVKTAISSVNTACTACHATGGVTVPHSGVQTPHKVTYLRETTTRCMTCHVDTGIAFNLSSTATNIAYHKVLENNVYYPTGIGLTSTSTKADGGTFVSPYTKTSALTCTGCHGTSDGTATGTVYGKLLKANYSTTTGKRGYNTSGDLCFNCHNYSTYTGSSSTSTWSSGSYTSGSTAFSAHTKDDHLIGCQGCHSIKPHSQSTNRHFIVIKGQANASTIASVTKYTHSTYGYSKSNCSTSCTNGGH